MTITSHNLPKPDQLELAAAVAGLARARLKHAWQGVKPTGGRNDDAEQIIETRGNAADDVAVTIASAQTRWPDATQWDLIGSDTNTWSNPQTFAQFTWPALTTANS